IVAPQVARIAADEGVDLVSVHGRTRAQQYRGQVDREAIAAVVDAVPGLPVLANGDIRSPDDVFEMLRATGAAGVMIGRAAVGNPWIFAHTLAAAEGRSAEAPSGLTRLETLERHVDWITRVVDDEAARTAQLRRYVAAYSKGLAGSGRFREHAQMETDPDRILSLARDFLSTRRAA
ncbi:MAG: tRNA-dihydrouridine synthase, partial [Myxococcota bacterium]